MYYPERVMMGLDGVSGQRRCASEPISASMAAQQSQSGATGEPQPKQWLGIYFKCCHAYGRLYKTADGKRYAGRCPRCMAQLQCMVGPGGTNQRFFEAS